MKDKLALVIFGEEFPHEWRLYRRYDIVVAAEKLRPKIQAAGLEWVDIDTLVEPGSIYDASALAEELSRLKFTDGSRISKSFLYEGYELWWIHYDSLFLNFCLPYTQYKKMLEHLQSFQQVHFYRPPHRSLFSCYLQAYGSSVVTLGEFRKSPRFLPFGIFVQIVLTLLSLLFLVMRKNRLMVYTGDKFGKDRDYDFRMHFVYEELRRRKIPFVEFIRGLESWRTTLQHAVTRKRPVVYSEAIIFIGRFVSILSGGRYRAHQKFGVPVSPSVIDSETRFKAMISTQYLLGVYDDMWAIRIMKLVLRVIGVKVAFVPSASERSFHAVLGCKLNKIPTIGIMHGVSSKHYNVSDFMSGFDGEKMLSVDIYGVWSEWWKEYYVKNSKIYRSEQLYISGPMRPHLHEIIPENQNHEHDGLIKVLFVSEQLSVPEEVLPYLSYLLKENGILVYLTFRPYRDGFEIWLKNNRPDILNMFCTEKILRNGITDAISKCDIVVGAHSTGVLEALCELKPMVFFSTKKWGDYYNLKEHNDKHSFFAESPEDLIEKIQNAKFVSKDILKNLRERYFGNPHKNGSKWVVEQSEQFLLKIP